ncbi:SAYSvFN domain-containing protein 1 [Vanacampus margaritifer]
MERRLADFRARRQANKRASSRDQFISSVLSTSLEEPSTNTDDQNLNRGSSKEVGRDTHSSWGRWLVTRRCHFSNITLLKVLLWVVLLGFFVELEFGLPFFVASLFYWLYEGLRDPDEREPGEMSAYSVFNPNCQSLLGALTAEQLEAEMGYRPLASS